MKNFWSKVDKTKDCWEWKAYKDKKGYGKFNLNGNTVRTHRVSWILTYGNPGNLCVLHKCDNPSCVNPEHLFLGTYDDNNKDRNKKGRQAKGVNIKNSKLNELDIPVIRKKISNGESYRKIAKDYGISHVQIVYIKNKKTWSHVL
jgi:uncharacterized protein YerC